MTDANTDIRPKLEVYLPDFTLQGQKIPFYIIWPNSLKLQIKIKIPKSFKILELYNLSESNFSTVDSEIVIKNVDVNGYLGGTFQTSLDPVPDRIEHIEFLINDGSSEQKYFKDVELFRQDVKLTESRNNKIVEYEDNKIKLSSTNKIENLGKGTAIVGFEILKESEVKESLPEGFEEFRNNLVKDLSVELKALQEKFPQYEEGISGFSSALNIPLPPREEDIKKFNEDIGLIDSYIRSDVQFLASFSEAIKMAYIKNFSLLVGVEELVSYLKSLKSARIILYDPLKTIQVEKGSHKLKLNMVIGDLANNAYQPIPLSDITIESDKNCRIPFYKLLD
ncbi:MAG: hypothetical protein JRN26_01370 [Nitrososphaerota archaeon]|jgi:hypothetical protein|nr:hypothetical protein [Nitrososphaerota archaeon]